MECYGHRDQVGELWCNSSRMACELVNERNESSVDGTYSAWCQEGTQEWDDGCKDPFITMVR